MTATEETALDDRLNGGGGTTGEFRTTDPSFGGVTGAEAMHVKDAPPSSELGQKGRQRPILVAFAGAAMLATTVLTILHFKFRKDRTRERQSRDIEVHSISGVGNELW